MNGTDKRPSSRSRKIAIGIVVVVAFCALCLSAGLAMDALGWLPTTTPSPVNTITSIPATQTHVPTISLTLDTQVEGTILILRGNTNLPDGAWLVYEIKHQDFLKSDRPLDQVFSEGQVQVMGSKYTHQIELTDWTAGQIEIWLAFQMPLGQERQQPDELIRRFGRNGEFLQGENVSIAGSIRRVELTQVMEFNP